MYGGAGEPLKTHFITSIDPEVNPWWRVFDSSCRKLGMTLKPEIFPAGTDSRFVRALGIPAFGFSPMANSPILLHEHDECLARSVFLRGISIYEGLIADLSGAVAV